MKKIINSPDTVVSEMCRGFVLAHPSIQLDEPYHILHKQNIDNEKVTLICGGGSGHEPAHGGYIGEGLLDAAVCGDVFASPSQIQVYQAIRKTKSRKGTLLIIKNYSGDMMNFTNAMEMAREDGILVDYVRVDDDIAVQDSLYTVGRRGVAGTVFVHKVAGAAAAAGMNLSEVKAIAEDAVRHIKSLGFAMTSCTVPAKGSPTFQIGEDEIEYGVGIHGEPGIRREKITTADQRAERMVSALLAELPEDGRSEGLAVLVNGFGATPLQELYLLANSVSEELQKRKCEINRVFVGNFLTSIDMAGASISIMGLNEQRKALLNADCNAPAMHIAGSAVPRLFASPDAVPAVAYIPSYTVESPESWSLVRNDRITTENLIYMIDCMSQIIIQNEVPFCELDSHAGDGDFGMSVAKGFRQLKMQWKDLLENHSETMGQFLDQASLIIMEHCGGASGPIWGSAFRAASRSVKNQAYLDLPAFAEMLQSAVQGVYKTGERSFGRGAVVGDKTLMDALIPCADSLSDSAVHGVPMMKALELAAQAAVAGADSTKALVARMGRAGTVGERSLGYPDAGAYALGVIFSELVERMQSAGDA